MSDPAGPRAPYPAALYLAVVQFLFVTCWTLYVIYLPGLLEAAGLPKRYAPWILVADQLTFMVMDVVTGMAADRAGRTLGRIGPLIVGLTAVSCVAFLLIPLATGWGALAPAAALAMILLWTLTSSALRAPPWVLLSRYTAAPGVPWMNALMLSGLAVGGAIAPYLGIALKNVDPRLPFALSSLALLATTAGLIWVERALARQPARPVSSGRVTARLSLASGLFVGACVLAAVGFQIHFSLNSAAQYLRVAAPERLPWLMPVFWIGFNLAMFPGAALANRHGALPVIAAAALIGASASLAGVFVRDLEVLLAAQLVVGGAWGCMLMAAFSAALEYGRTGREGLVLGLLFAALAAAALGRIAAVALEVNRIPGMAPAFEWTPFVLWLAAGLLFVALARGKRERAVPGAEC
jgi:MFS family permease